jgi:phenylacetate-CoA ligase
MLNIMNIARYIANTYGDIRAFNRSSIRHEVEHNVHLVLAKLGDMQERVFQQCVHNAIVRFPKYADKVGGYCGKVPRPGDMVNPEDIPVWTRQDQQSLFASLPGPPIPGAFVHSTGGSTGEPTRFYVTRESYEWRTAVADRGYSWAEAEEGRRSYYVWGSPIKPLSKLKKMRSCVQHLLQNRRYYDSFVFDEKHKVACCRGISRFKPSALVGYAGNLVDLALFVRSHPGLLTWKAKTLVTGAEGLLHGQREILEEVLADEVFMSYGSREFMLIGMECREHRGYHVSSDNLHIEVVDEAGRPCVPGETGRILVTDLHNAANPFIRYEIGDMGTMGAETCPCGLPFPLLASVNGRTQEYLYTTAGVKMTALFIPHLMKEFPWVMGYQLLQFDRMHVSVNVITDGNVSQDMAALLMGALKGKLGEGMNVKVERVVALKKGLSGKVPIVIHGSI